jgi:glutathione S-transferase
MKIELYYAPITCALAPYITLTEAGAPFDVRAVNMRKGENRTPAYLAMNPKHQVPVLVIDGQPLTENVAIHFWIHRNFPAARLIPSDPTQELKAMSLMSWFSSGIHPFLARINAPSRVCDAPGAEAAVVRIAQEQLYERYKIADDLLAGRQFFFDHFTAPDAHFFWCYRRGTQFNLDMAQFKNCTAHFERMKARPSVQKLFAYEQQVQSEFAKVA